MTPSPERARPSPLPEHASAEDYLARGREFLKDADPLGLYYLAAAVKMAPGQTGYRRELEAELARFPRVLQSLPLGRMEAPDLGESTRGDGAFQNAPALSDDGRFLFLGYPPQLFRLGEGIGLKGPELAEVQALAFTGSDEVVIWLNRTEAIELKAVNLKSRRVTGASITLSSPPLAALQSGGHLLVLTRDPNGRTRTLRRYRWADLQPQGVPLDGLDYVRWDSNRVMVVRNGKFDPKHPTYLDGGQVEVWDSRTWKRQSQQTLDDAHIFVGTDVAGGTYATVEVFIWLTIRSMDGRVLFPRTSIQKIDGGARRVASGVTNDGRWFSWTMEPSKRRQFWHLDSGTMLPPELTVEATDFHGRYALARLPSGQLTLWDAEQQGPEAPVEPPLPDWGFRSLTTAQFGADHRLLLKDRHRLVVFDPERRRSLLNAEFRCHWAGLPPNSTCLLASSGDGNLSSWQLQSSEPLRPDPDPFALVARNLGLWPTSSKLTGLRCLSGAELQRPPHFRKWR